MGVGGFYIHLGVCTNTKLVGQRKSSLIHVTVNIIQYIFTGFTCSSLVTS